MANRGTAALVFACLLVAVTLADAAVPPVSPLVCNKVQANFCILVLFKNIFYKKTYAKTFAENRPFFRRLRTWRQGMRVGVDWHDAEVLPRHGRPRSTATRWRMGSDTSALCQPTPQAQPRRVVTPRRASCTMRFKTQFYPKNATEHKSLSFRTSWSV